MTPLHDRVTDAALLIGKLALAVLAGLLIGAAVLLAAIAGPVIRWVFVR